MAKRSRLEDTAFLAEVELAVPVVLSLSQNIRTEANSKVGAGTQSKTCQAEKKLFGDKRLQEATQGHCGLF